MSLYLNIVFVSLSLFVSLSWYCSRTLYLLLHKFCYSVTILVVWYHSMCSVIFLYVCHVFCDMRFICVSLYMHIRFGSCRKLRLCATMYVASPLNLLRRLPFILNTLCYNVCGISSEPSCLVSQRMQSMNIYWKSSMCFANCETFIA